jgi:hypothetical protein
MLNRLSAFSVSPVAGRRWLLGVAAFVFAFGLLAYIQFASPHLIDHDGYYHIKMASLIRTEGIPVPFPWLPLTILDEAGYTDHHFLQHVLQMPFTYLGDLQLAAKWAAIGSGTLAFMAFFWLLQRYEVRYPLFWLFLLCASSNAFLFRMSMPRGQSLSLALQCLVVFFLLTRHRIGLVVTSAVFVWAYNGFPLLGPLTICAIIAHFVVDKKIEYMLIVSVGAGIVLGLVLHPYFPRDIVFLWNHIVPKLFASEFATSVGSEWYPYKSSVLLQNAPLAIGAYVTALLLTNRDEWKQDAPRLFFFLASTLYLLLLFKSRRFVEYFPPFAILFLAFTARGWLREHDLARVIRTEARLGGFLLASLALLWVFQSTITLARKEISESPDTAHYQGGAHWLATNTPAGARVFHTDWDEFPMLFYFNTHNTYLVGLDPDFMRLKNEKLFRSWEAITRGKVRQPEDAILNDFGCEYVLTDNDHPEFIALANKNPRMRKMYEDQHTTVYRVLKNQLLIDLSKP